MIYDIRHVTSYSYESAVSFARCSLRNHRETNFIIMRKVNRRHEERLRSLLFRSIPHALIFLAFA